VTGWESRTVGMTWECSRAPRAREHRERCFLVFFNGVSLVYECYGIVYWCALFVAASRIHPRNVLRDTTSHGGQVELSIQPPNILSSSQPPSANSHEQSFFTHC